MGHSKEVLFNTIGTVTTLFFQWLIIMLIPKITNFTEAGIFTVAISICSILNHIATFSLKEHHIADQRYTYSDQDYATARIITIILSFVMIIPFSLLFHYNSIQILVIIGYMIYRNLLHYAYIYSASLQVSEKLEYVGKCTALEGITSFIAFIAIYPVTHSLPLAVFVMAIIGGGIFFISQRKGYTRYVPADVRNKKYTPEHVKTILLVGVPLLLSILAPTIITALPKLLLQNLFDESMAGIFGTLSTPTIIVPTLAISIFAPFITDFSTICREGNMSKLRNNYLKMCTMLIIFGIILTLLSLFLQDPVFTWMYGNDISPYAKYFAYLVFGITIYSIGTIGTTVLITKNQGVAAAVSSILSLVIAIILSYNMINNSGIEGATISLVAAYTAFGMLISLCVFALPIKNKSFRQSPEGL